MGSSDKGEIHVLLVGPEPPEDVPRGVRVTWRPIVRAKTIPESSLRVLEALQAGVDAVVFTSPRGPSSLAYDARVNDVFEEVVEYLSSTVIWSIGPRTAERVYRYFRTKSKIPREYRGSVLGEEIAYSIAGSGSVLGIRGTKVVKDLEEVLRSHRIEYREIHVYDLVPVRGIVRSVKSFLNVVDAVLLTSPFIVKVYRDMLGRRAWMHTIVAIGPSTAREIRRLGGAPFCIPERYTVFDALVCLVRRMSNY